MPFEKEPGDKPGFDRTEIELLEQQLRDLLEKLDSIGECKIAAVHVDEAITSLSRIKGR